MPRGVPSKLWSDETIKKKFMKLCKKSLKPSVNWDKFRELDEDGVFKKIPIPHLSAQFRKMRFIEEGLCWSCGKEEPDKKADNGLCKSCIKYVRECKERSDRKKEKDAKRRKSN
jgi:hypothetical protein